MSKPITLLDMAVQRSFAKHSLITPSIRSTLLAARKFVLSESMSSYLADLTCAPFSGFASMRDASPGVAARVHRRATEIIESARHLARGPHAVTWIEYDCVARRRRSKQAYSHFIGTSSGSFIENDDAICPRIGWLIEQHPSIATAFRMTEFMQLGNDSCGMLPYGWTWTTDDASVLPWRNISKLAADFNFALPATGIKGYDTDRIGMVWADGYDDFNPDLISELLLESMGELRAVWCLLATLDDIPTSYDHVRPSKGYVAKGSYRRFSEHSVITLNVPAHRSLKTLAARALTTLRRRAHNVIGHWRDDFRHPPATQCEHVWHSRNERVVQCAHCEGRKTFIAEHVRGDTSLGFVLHDYNVNHPSRKGELIP
jgi:hypothetical protein